MESVYSPPFLNFPYIFSSQQIDLFIYKYSHNPNFHMYVIIAIKFCFPFLRNLYVLFVIDLPRLYTKYSIFGQSNSRCFNTINVLQMLHMFPIHHKWFTLNTKEVFNGWNSNSTTLWLFVLFSRVFTPWKRFSIPTPPDADDLVVYIISIMNKQSLTAYIWKDTSFSSL